MNKITILRVDGTTFVKHESFMLPSFDGDAKFDIGVAMVSIGARQIGKTASWATSLTAVELAGYLSFLQTSKLGAGSARRAWIMQWKLQRLLFSRLPFKLDGDIDWDKLRTTVEKEIAVEFPNCA